MSAASFFYLGVLVIGVILLLLYHSTGKLLKCLFFTLFSGVGALGVLWALGLFIDIPLTVTPLSLMVSGILGIPGVIGMLVLQLI